MTAPLIDPDAYWALVEYYKTVHPEVLFPRISARMIERFQEAMRIASFSPMPKASTGCTNLRKAILTKNLYRKS